MRAPSFMVSDIAEEASTPVQVRKSEPYVVLTHPDLNKSPLRTSENAYFRKCPSYHGRV